MSCSLLPCCFDFLLFLAICFLISLTENQKHYCSVSFFYYENPLTCLSIIHCLSILTVIEFSLQYAHAESKA